MTKKEKDKKIAERVLLLTTYKQKMKEKGITTYMLVRLTGLKTSTTYSYMAGGINLTTSLCAIFADAINVDIGEAFPHLIINKNLIELNNTEQENDMAKRTEFSEMDMVTSAASMSPTAGYIARARSVTDHLGTVHDHLLVQSETHVTVATGIKAPENIDRIMPFGMKDHIIKHEAFVYQKAFAINGELCISLYVHGKPLMISRGIEIASLLEL